MLSPLVILVIVVITVTSSDLVAQRGRYGGGEIQDVRVLRLISVPPRSLGLLLPTVQKLR